MERIDKVERVKKGFSEKEFLEVKGEGFINMVIPVDEKNRDYRKLKKMEEEGKVVIEDKTKELV